MSNGKGMIVVLIVFYAEYNKDSNEKDPKFKVADPVRISKYKNIFTER